MEKGLGENSGRGEIEKKPALWREETFLFLKENDKYGPAPKRILFQKHWFSHSPWSPPLRFLTPWEGKGHPLNQLG